MQEDLLIEVLRDISRTLKCIDNKLANLINVIDENGSVLGDVAKEIHGVCNEIGIQ